MVLDACPCVISLVNILWMVHQYIEECHIIKSNKEHNIHQFCISSFPFISVWCSFKISQWLVYCLMVFHLYCLCFYPSSHAYKRLIWYSYTILRWMKNNQLLFTWIPILSCWILGTVSWVHNILCPVSIDDCWFKRYWSDLTTLIDSYLLIISSFPHAFSFPEQPFTDGNKHCLHKWLLLSI